MVSNLANSLRVPSEASFGIFGTGANSLANTSPDPQHPAMKYIASAPPRRSGIAFPAGRVRGSDWRQGSDADRSLVVLNEGAQFPSGSLPLLLLGSLEDTGGVIARVDAVEEAMERFALH